MTSTGLEIPIFGSASASSAVSFGATRLELNAAGSYPRGGTTPSLSELDRTVAALGSSASGVPLRVMVRPRGPPADGSPDFLYSAEEFVEMRQAIVEFKKSGFLDPKRGDGFVFGVLRRVGGGADRVVVDVERNAELVALARPLRSVFHRAFDDVVGGAAQLSQEEEDQPTWRRALDDVVECGFNGVLTSGGPGTAPGNSPILKDIVVSAKGRVEIVVGGGVRSSNVRELAITVRHHISPVWFHSSCLTAKGGAEEVDGQEIQSILREVELLHERGGQDDLT